MIVVATLTKVLSNFTAWPLYVCNVYISWRALVHSPPKPFFVWMTAYWPCLSPWPESAMGHFPQLLFIQVFSVGWLQRPAHVKLKLSGTWTSDFLSIFHILRIKLSPPRNVKQIRNLELILAGLTCLYLTSLHFHVPNWLELMHTCGVSAPGGQDPTLPRLPKYLPTSTLDGFMIYLFATHHLEYFKTKLLKVTFA